MNEGEKRDLREGMDRAIQHFVDGNMKPSEAERVVRNSVRRLDAEQRGRPVERRPGRY